MPSMPRQFATGLECADLFLQVVAALGMEHLGIFPGFSGGN